MDILYYKNNIETFHLKQTNKGENKYMTEIKDNFTPKEGAYEGFRLLQKAMEEMGPTKKEIEETTNRNLIAAANLEHKEDRNKAGSPHRDFC